MAPRPATGVTPVRHVRIPEGIWAAAKRIAAERGETLAAVINRALQRYIREHEKRGD